MGLFSYFRRNDVENAEVREPELPAADGVHNVQAPTSVNADALVNQTDQKPAAGDSDEFPAEPVDPETVQNEIIEAIKQVYDPEIPVNIYELGLIYEVKVQESGETYIKMTLTAPNCPAAGILPGQIEGQARTVAGVRDVKLELVFDPPWSPDMMSEGAKLELGML